MPLPTAPKNNKSAVPTTSDNQPRKSQSLPMDVVAYNREPSSDDGWAIDPRTGIRHRVLPKTEMDNEGNPVLQFEDFDTQDLNKEANDFLAHLRVPASKS